MAKKIEIQTCSGCRYAEHCMCAFGVKSSDTCEEWSAKLAGYEVVDVHELELGENADSNRYWVVRYSMNGGAAQIKLAVTGTKRNGEIWYSNKVSIPACHTAKLADALKKLDPIFNPPLPKTRRWAMEIPSQA